METRSARRFWGGVTRDGATVVTAWAILHDGNGRVHVRKPQTNHGGLKEVWERGDIRVGTEVRLILLRQQGNARAGSSVRWPA